MKSKKRWVISGGAMGVLLLLGVFLSHAAEGQVQEERGRQIQKAAQFGWAEGVLTETVQAVLGTFRSSDAVPRRIPSEALSIIRSTVGFDHERNLRLALTLLEKETGRSLAEIFLTAETGVPPAVVSHIQAGWGGFWEFGFFALTGFLFSMLMFSWVLTDLEYPIEKEAKRPQSLRLAA